MDTRSKKEKKLNGSQAQELSRHRIPYVNDPRIHLYGPIELNNKKKKKISKKKKAFRDQSMRRKKKQIIRKLREELGEILDTEEEKKVLRMEIEQKKIDRKSYNTFVNELRVAQNLSSYNYNDEINDEKTDKPKTYSKKKY